MAASSSDQNFQLLRGAIRLVSAGRLEAAGRIIDEVLRRDETNGTAWIVAARLAEAQDRELFCLARAVSCPSLDDSPANREAALFAGKRLERLLDSAVGDDAVGRAELLIAAGLSGEARRLLDAALEDDRTNGPAWLLAARLAATRAGVHRALSQAAAAPSLDDTPANREAAARAQAGLARLKPGS
jgi:tetratricopeptide (TPR) repeat protein